MRRLLIGVTVALAVAVGVPLVSPGRSAASPSIAPFRQLGAWIDVFDYAPRLQQPGVPPRITPESMADMARLGVRTLYVQVANPDGAPTDQLTDRVELRALLERAHGEGIAIVPWFLPSLTTPADDVNMVERIAALRAGGERIDGIGLDLESTEVADVPLRNQRTVDFAERVRKIVGESMPIAAIVYPAVQLDVLNTTLWPDFPYQRLAQYTDVWMPMSYYTFRSTESGLRSAYRYTVDSVDRLRRHLGDERAPVHILGGLAEISTPDDYLDLEPRRSHHEGGGMVGLRLRDDVVVGVAVPARRGAGPDHGGATDDRRTDAPSTTSTTASTTTSTTSPTTTSHDRRRADTTPALIVAHRGARRYAVSPAWDGASGGERRGMSASVELEGGVAHQLLPLVGGVDGADGARLRAHDQ